MWSHHGFELYHVPQKEKSGGQRSGAGGSEAIINNVDRH